MTVLAVLLAVTATALAVPSTRRLSRGHAVTAGHGGPAGPVGGPQQPVARWRRPGALGTALVLTAAAAIGVGLDGRRLALALVASGAAAATGMLARRARAVRLAERRRATVVDVCEALVGELRSGQPVQDALEHAVEVWPELRTVAVAARLGADVPAALSRTAALPGAEGLRQIASAWQVSHRSGAGLAGALSQVAETARARQATRHLVRGELASAQATARLVALLPLASLAMSSGIGGHPWHFLLGTTVGIACLAAGALSAFAGLLWIDRIAEAVLRG